MPALGSVILSSTLQCPTEQESSQHRARIGSRSRCASFLPPLWLISLCQIFLITLALFRQWLAMWLLDHNESASSALITANSPLWGGKLLRLQWSEIVNLSFLCHSGGSYLKFSYSSLSPSQLFSQVLRCLAF